MTVRIARVIASLALTLGLGGCTNFYEIPIETPIKPKMDVSSFQAAAYDGSSSTARCHRYRASCQRPRRATSIPNSSA